MREHELIALTAPPTLAVVRAIREDQLTARTPCAEYDVRGLIDHMLHWGPSLARAGRPTDGTAQTGGSPLERQIEEVVAAWSVPAAWQGVTSMGGPHEMPARMIGAMAAGEIVVHGWDLARATGQEVAWDETLLEFLYDEVAKTAELGREMQAYAAEVPVPRTAPVLDRMLGLTGRDPHWTPEP
jgi:uncharacterized protein (TIGR03086 family)